MKKTEQYQELLQILQECKERAIVLEQDLDAVKESLSGERFLQESEFNLVREDLAKLEDQQNRFFTLYDALVSDSAPEYVVEAQDVLERKLADSSEWEKSRDVIDGVLRLQSEDSSVQKALEKHQNDLRNLDVEHMESGQLQEILAPYAALLSWLTKADAGALYKAHSLGSEIFEAAVNHLLYLPKEVNEATAQVLTDDYTKNTAESVQTQHVGEIADSQTITEAAVAEESEDSEFVTLLKENNVLLTKDADMGIFSVKRNTNAENKKISSTIFQNEMRIGIKSAEKAIISVLDARGLVTMEYLASVNHMPYDVAVATLDYLWKTGYVCKYELMRAGEFYCPTKRLMKAMTYKESSRFAGIRQKQMEDWGADIEDSPFSVAARLAYMDLLCGSWRRFAKKDVPNFNDKAGMWAESFCLWSYVKGNCNEEEVAVGAFWNDAEECDSFLEAMMELLEECGDINRLFVAGTDQDHAAALMKVLLELPGYDFTGTQLYVYALFERQYYTYPNLIPADEEDIGTTQPEEASEVDDVQSPSEDTDMSEEEDKNAHSDTIEDAIKCTNSDETEIADEDELSEAEMLAEMGLDDLTNLAVQVDPDLFVVEKSSKANYIFKAKDFNRDLDKFPAPEKRICLAFAKMYGGYKISTLQKICNRLSMQDRKNFLTATEKLFNAGYIEKCTVKGYGTYYALTERGKFIFKSGDALKNLIPDQDDLIKNLKYYPDRYIDIDSNAAALNLLYLGCRDREFQINSQGAENFEGIPFNYSFFGRFERLYDDRDVCFTTVITDQTYAFYYFYQVIQGELQENDILIVIGYTKEQGRQLAQWLLTACPEMRSNIYYCDARENVYYSAVTDEEMQFDDPEGCSGENAKRENAGDTVQKKEPVLTHDVLQEPQEPDVEDSAGPEPDTEDLTESESDVQTARTKGNQEEEHEFSVQNADFNVDSQQGNTLEYMKMLTGRQFYAASAYLKALSLEAPAVYAAEYRQLAYALNDPMENPDYRSDQIIKVFYTDTDAQPVSDYFVVAAAARTYFMDQENYGYSLTQLQNTMAGNTLLQEHMNLKNFLYKLQNFKSQNQCGIDKYADYHRHEGVSWEKQLLATCKSAQYFHENYCLGKLHETKKQKRFIITNRLLFSDENSDLRQCLEAVIADNRDKKDYMETFLQIDCVKDQAVISSENLDEAKIERLIEEYWDRAGRELRLEKKSSKLMGDLRNNLKKRLMNGLKPICDYVALLNSSSAVNEDVAQSAYKKLRAPLLNDIEVITAEFAAEKSDKIKEMAGKNVLLATLHELKERLCGEYNESNRRFYYIDFLRTEHVYLDDQFCPVLNVVEELPEMSALRQIEMHNCAQKELWEKRLESIIQGGDDYGSADLILQYLDSTDQITDTFDMKSYVSKKEKSYENAYKEMERKRQDFVAELELAQSYGKLNDSAESGKEKIMTAMEMWYGRAEESGNYSFFKKLTKAFKEKIEKDALVRQKELENNLQSYMEQNPECSENPDIEKVLEQIKERICQQNYTAAEDLLNRLMEGDLESGADLLQEDYFADFMKEYQSIYNKVYSSSRSFQDCASTVIRGGRKNKDSKGGARLIENWPSSKQVASPDKLRNLLRSLDFQVGEVKEKASIGNIIEFEVSLKRPENGKKVHYKHPIAAFGSDAERRGLRVVFIFGRMEADRLIETCKDIGTGRNTLIFIDDALQQAQRRKLARRMKVEPDNPNSKVVYAIADRVVITYLARHYTSTLVNRMLMALVMPFAYYQPYIDKSAYVMPPEMFIGRKTELEEIEDADGVNIVYGGRQLGKTALLRMAQKDIDCDEEGNRAIVIDVLKLDYKKAAEKISGTLYVEGILKQENVTDDWSELTRDIKKRLKDDTDRIPYFLLMIDEADALIESSAAVDYLPFSTLKDLQSSEPGRFKFVVAGLRNVVRFKKEAALGNNSVLAHLSSLTVKPFKAIEARELLEVPLSYLGFRFPRDNETEMLISTIFGTTNYFPGLIQLYCTKLIEALKKRDYAGYAENDTPPYIVQKDLIKKVLGEQNLQEEIRQKFLITLWTDPDHYYHIIALLLAYQYHQNVFGESQNGCSAQDLIQIATEFEIPLIMNLDEERLIALMEEMRELNVLRNIGGGRYLFTRYNFSQMLGNLNDIEDELLKYM